MFLRLFRQSSKSSQEVQPAQTEAGLRPPPGAKLKQISQVALVQLRSFSENEALNSRVLTHLVVIILVALALSLRNFSWAQQNIGALRPQPSALAEPAAPVVIDLGRPLALPAQLSNLQGDVIVPAAVPHTIIPERAREEITTYVVEPGDTVFNIAAKFGLAPETITWSNHELEDNPDLLSVGQELRILPVNGVYHQVGAGDTIESIAAAYQVEAAAIIDYALNELNPDNPELEPGQWLVAPGGVCFDGIT